MWQHAYASQKNEMVVHRFDGSITHNTIMAAQQEGLLRRVLDHAAYAPIRIIVNAKNQAYLFVTCSNELTCEAICNRFSMYQGFSVDLCERDYPAKPAA